MSTVLTLQDAILRLHRYWGERGCVIWEPANTEVGAGTMNVATFLRVLGPEPWNVAYVEPSVRPDDSRYGENPNRVQMHTQYQVILKPDPGNPQDLYLDSLAALGIDTAKHDIRFVEDNWESPALSAWGLGWEVWLDGLEITQFTYFQQAGGFQLDPVAVEITYGLERILMYLQGVDHFKKLLYAPGITYDEVLGQNEYEMSVYNLDAADIDRMRELFAAYEAEARMLLERKLPLPAYSYILKTSHAFNLLDARGAVGVTERARFFARMRELARDVAKLWRQRREEQGYPLGTPTRVTPALPTPAPAAQSTSAPPFLLEIGSEELPPADVAAAVEQLQRLMPELLAGLRLDHGPIDVQATPRRLVVRVEALAAAQRQDARQVRGPKVEIAYDAAGQPTKALLGFARSQKVDVSSVERQTIDGAQYVVATVRPPARPVGEVLSEALPELLGKLGFPRSMRWNLSNVAYSRPLRWFVALHGETVVPFIYADTLSGRTSRGLRNAARPTFDVARADGYAAQLADAGIVVDVATRRAQIAAQSASLAGEVGGQIPASTDELLDEVVHLVEAPRPIRGSFDPAYLRLPRDVLVTVMRKHQRYFPIENAQGELLPYFVAVANGPVDADAVRRGNEAVLRARYADAEFYWNHDTARRLEEYRPGLATMTFQAKLGSILDKNERLERLVPVLADRLGLTPTEREVAQRAAFLAKADLATQMVTEFTNLAGIMGRQYAQRSGEPPPVAEAIFEHVLPRAAGDAVPTGRPGILLALADRLDSLVGLFAVGLAPSASADPFALRRAALGVVQILTERDVDLDLRVAVHDVAGLAPVPVSAEVEEQVVQFIVRRFEQSLHEAGERADLIRAVLAVRGHRPARALRSVRELAAVAGSERFQRLVTAYSRPTRLVREREVGVAVDPSRFETDQERSLWQAVGEARRRATEDSSVPELLDALEPLHGPIEAFFNHVFVMVDDRAVRDNRLALLRHVAELPGGIIDLTKIDGF